MKGVEAWHAAAAPSFHRQETRMDLELAGKIAVVTGIASKERKARPD
jgi:hypothetical protein